MSASKLKSESNGFYRLSWLQRIGFGSGDFAQNLIFQTVMQYVSIFYITVVGLRPETVAVMVFIPPIINIFGSMALGTFVDRHNPKWGKYRSYLIIGGVPLMAFAVLCFWNGFPGSTLYAFVTYIGLCLLYTVVSLPYGALFASLTRDNEEMDKLTSTRMVLANLGGFTVAFGIPTIVRLLSPTNTYNTAGDAHAWFITMSILAVVGVFLLIFCFTQSKERVVIDSDKTSEVKMSDLWMEFARNGQLRIVALFIFTAFALMSVYNSAGAYYMTYNLQASNYTGWFQGIGFLPAFIFLPLVPAIKRTIGKKQMFYLFLCIAIFGMAMLYTVSVIESLRSQIWLVMAAQFIKCTGIIVATGYMWALVPEVITYGEYTTGRRISGTVNAIIGIVFQLGMAIGLFIPNIVLSFVGFDRENAAMQSPGALQGILWLVAVIPAILLVVAMFIISRYKLDDSTIDKINIEIESRRSESV